MLRARIAMVIGLVGVASAAPAAAQEQRFEVFSNAEKVGHVVATTDGDRVSVDYAVDDNGRGSKLRERVRIGANGLPVEWSVEGRAWFGAPVREEFAVRGKSARWKSLNDAGSARFDTPKFYVANDSSPWAYALALRALLDDADQKVDALPAGSLRAEKLKELTVGTGDTAQPVIAYALWGINSEPELILLRPDRSVFAFVDAGWVVLPEGRGAEFESLSTLAQSLQREYLQRLSAQHVHRYDSPIYIRNVRVFDSKAGSLGEPTTVVVFRDRISSVRADAEPPADVVVVDGEGGTLLPGLMDVHAHMWSWAAPQHLAAGVTTVRDPGNDNQVLLELTSQIDSGEIMGPRILRQGFIEGRTPFSARGGFVVDRLPLALEKVRWYADHGFRGIKIYNSMTPDWVAPLAVEAHRLGLNVMGHVPAFMSSERAIRDGYDEITHINQLMLSLVIDTAKEDTRTPFRFTALGERIGKVDLASEPVKRLVKLMKERNTAIDPTVATFGQMLLGRAGKVAETDAPWLAHMPAAVQRSRKTPLLDMKAGDDALYRASWDKLLAMIKLLHDEGIRILPGTDDAAGVVLHSELETYSKAGISNARVLQIATIDVARYLGLDQDVGSIEPGKLADLILVAGNPLESIGEIRQIRMVMRNGDAMYPEDIYTALGIAPFGRKPRVTVPAGAIAAR
ncbi:MAG: amidohydrolase family protein [Gammaproteobacteria bacterium]